MYKEKRNIVLTIFLFFQIGIVALLSHFPSIIDKYYVNGVYPIIANTLRFLFGWIPFSVGDIIYAVLIFLILRFLKQLLINKSKNRRALIFQFFAGISVFYFCFYLFWGLNYSRSPLSKTLGLCIRGSHSAKNNLTPKKARLMELVLMQAQKRLN